MNNNFENNITDLLIRLCKCLDLEFQINQGIRRGIGLEKYNMILNEHLINDRFPLYDGERLYNDIFNGSLRRHLRVFTTHAQRNTMIYRLCGIIEENERVLRNIRMGSYH